MKVRIFKNVFVNIFMYLFIYDVLHAFVKYIWTDEGYVLLLILLNEKISPCQGASISEGLVKI
jgi:hypothetical protein